MIWFWCTLAALAAWVIAGVLADDRRTEDLANWNRHWHYERQSLVSQHAEQYLALKADYRQMNEEWAADRELLAAKLAESRRFRDCHERLTRQQRETQRDLDQQADHLNKIARLLQEERDSIHLAARGYANAVSVN